MKNLQHQLKLAIKTREKLIDPMEISSFQSHNHHQRTPPPSPTIESLESSIQHLVTKWQRRQRWQLLFLLPSGLCCQPQQEESHHNPPKRAPWRSQLASFLDSLPVHLATILLLLLDLSLTILDLSSSILSCSASKKSKDDNELYYHWAGIAILSLLSAKALALALALGSSFFASPGHVVDGLVAIGALLLEALAEGKGAGLLVVVSLWRVIRVVESAFELSNEAIEAQVEEVLVQFEVLRGENQRLEEVVVEEEERVRQLEEELARRQSVA